jgi:hypothetical protein
MAVVSVSEIWEGRDASLDRESRDYSRVFRVVTDSRYDSGYLVAAAVGVVVGSPHPHDPGSVCQRVRPTQQSFSPYVWLVTCSYSSKKQVEDNPLNDPIEYEWDTESFSRPAIVDRNGNAILNSAGDPFFEPIEVDHAYDVVRISANVASVPVWFLGVKNRVNASQCTIDGVQIAARCARIKSTRVGKVQSRNEITYRQIQIEILCRSAPWNEVVLDAGFRELADADEDEPAGKHRAITDADGSEPKHPVPLDGEGKKLVDPTPLTARFLAFEVYAETNFSALPGVG